MNSSMIYKFLTAVFASLLIGGCASHSNSGSIAQFSLDQAAVFGEVVDSFVLPDGIEGSIRRFNKNYSVKLQRNSRVIDIELATQVKFRSAQPVDGYTLIMLEKAERNCQSKTHLLAIRGAEVRAWDFGNCRTWPESTISSDAATFYVEEGAGTIQYQFTGGRLLYGPAPKRSPQIPTRPATAENQPPASPVKSGDAAAPARPKSTEVPTAASRKTAPAPYVPPAAPIFKPKEQAPRTIYLDK
jgi:hypothetical protein